MATFQPGTSRRSMTVALIADPDLPNDIADALAGELDEVLARRVSPAVSWRVTAVSELLVADEQISVTHMVDAVTETWAEQGWDMAIFLTDMPRRADTQPVAAEVAAAHRIALISLPALGSVRLHARACEAVVRLVEVLFHQPGARDEPRLRLFRRLFHVPGVVGRMEPADGGGARYVVPGVRGQLRLLAGMVRANRPWRLFRELSRAQVGVIGTAAYAVVSPTTWRLGVALGPTRLTILTVVSIVALAAWLIIDKRLWERPSSKVERHRAILYNAATAITLCAGVALLYLALLVVLVVVARFLIDPEVMRSMIQTGLGPRAHLHLAWFATSFAMIGGALGSGLENDEAVRNAAYGERQRQRQQRRQENNDSDPPERSNGRPDRGWPPR
jgi:hypothetical protein